MLCVTLAPSSNELTSSGFCVFCGERGLADAILNIGLFLPLGWILRRAGSSPLVPLALGVLFSGMIELIQVATPGRDATVGDILFNGAGGALGALSWPALCALVAPSETGARRAAAMWAAALASSFVALAVLLWPGMPSDLADVVQRPPAPEGGRFEGRILDHRFIAESGRLEIDFVAARTRQAFRPLLSIVGTDGSVMSIGPAYDRLILRVPRPVDRLRLTRTDLELRGAFEGRHEGDTLGVAMEPRGDGVCLEITGRRRCGLGYTVGSGWALLAPTGWFDTSGDRRIDALWMLALFVPFGYWYRGGVTGIAPPASAVFTALLVPLVTPLLAAPLATLGGAVGGIAVGLVAGRVASWRNRRAG